MKKGKRFVLGMLVIALVFGMSLAGCASIPPNYYNLGDVSEENCALVDSTPSFYHSNNQSSIDGSISIDGQGSWREWVRPHVLFAGEGKAIVRITPGTHTFTIRHRASSDPNAPFKSISITYDCKAGYGYTFSFSDYNATYGLADINVGKIRLQEWVIDENGNFAQFGSRLNNSAEQIGHP